MQRANAYGNPVEQYRFRRKYRLAKAINKDDVRRCRNCMAAHEQCNGSIQCSLDGCMVAPGGQCLQWAARTAEGLPLLAAGLVDKVAP